jgi:hypothetical protein
MNTFPQTKEKKISPLGVNFIVGGTCIIFGFTGGIAFTLWAIYKYKLNK